MNQICKKIARVITTILMTPSAIAMFVATCLAFYGVIARYAFGTGYLWMEEVIRMLFLLGAFGLAGPMLLNDGNVALTIVLEVTKNEKLKHWIGVFNMLVCTIVALPLAIWSTQFFLSVEGQTTFSTIFPKQLPSAILPIGMWGMFVCGVLKLIILLTDKPGEEAAAAEIESGAEERT